MRIRNSYVLLRLATLCTRGFGGFLASTPALIATVWSEPGPGRVYPPRERNDRGRKAGPVLRGRKGCVYALIGILPERGWAARQYRDRHNLLRQCTQRDRQESSARLESF